MRREIKRTGWEEEVVEELNGPIHYESLRSGEIRELGVGYYAFSTDQETREKQIKMLQKMREDTQKEKRNLKDSEKRKRSALQARLERVRLGRIKKLKAQGKVVPGELLKPIELPEIEDKKSDSDNRDDNDVTVVEVTKRDDRDRRVREWDEGKEWTPAELPKPPPSWNDPREERLDEFAPPSFYFKGQRSNEAASVVTSNDESRQNFIPKEIPSNSSKETPSDLISRIRQELSDIVKSSVTEGNDSATCSRKSSTDEAQTDDSLTATANKLSDEDDSVATPCVECADLYVPCPDKPISMKVKVLPKKNSVLSKSAFHDE